MKVSIRTVLCKRARHNFTGASAALAKYYVAVIDDYCLKNTPSALRSYERFVHQNPNANPYVDKAKQRIAVLRAQK